MDKIKLQNMYLGGLISVYLIATVTLIVGYLANIWQLVTILMTGNTMLSVCSFLKIVGVLVAPLGGVMGVLGFFNIC